ncbi:XPG N-terminal [Kalmanozyma brasiliensis GHG001]|uniref:XPG N-terminal n=1 Tax=Kalmanozyma brasiliensis (strain GHG001) TaxID=1365824 RepID=UPI001CE941F8|nr:XPG N-terminal [Kalmanozyma brasiliensis GHG001]EST09304.2 XPG N-terminal [Kalmanozyma brasiliensis GHG001]
MRVSFVTRGIRGIFPLVRSLAPQAISPPFSLPALRGLRLAIDATLLVQRLHFADDPHASRHIIGFYRLVTSLRQHGVIPMMVFDHPQKRLALKDREQVKRRHKRELDRIRSKLEHERRGRLLELQSHLDALSELQVSERRQVGELLDKWRTPTQESPAEVISQPSTSAVPSTIAETVPTPTPRLPAPTSKTESVAYSMHTNWMQLEESLRSGASSQSKGQKVLAEAEKEIYQTIATQLMSGEAPPPLPSPVESFDRADDIAAEAGPSHPLSSINAMHHSLSKTYDRATSPLSASIYKDCAELCSLMAVPVFWTGDGTRTGGGRIHEAEAYAASLVRSGFADLVASEDSDVLLYEAPLLRGLMGGVRNPGALGREAARGKLEVICGTRVRTGLFPKADTDKLAHLTASSELVKTEESDSDLSYDRMARSLMLDFALLCGTDFNRTIPGIGPKTALRLLKEHGSISTILRKEAKKFQPPEGLSIREYETELRHARMVFLQPPKVRAAARSILGTPASEAAAETVSQSSGSALIERVLFAEGAAAVQSDEAAIADDIGASDGAATIDAGVNTYCTADPAVGLDEIATEAVTSPQPGAEVTYDRQAVHDFLRSHGVFRTSSSDPDTDAFELYEPSASRQQEWRDLLDLELGLTTPATISGFNSILEESPGESEALMGMTTLGADFFGERKAVACWNPGMEQHVRQETTAK